MSSSITRRRVIALPGGAGGITSIIAGNNITIDNTDPFNPIISTTAEDIINVANYTALPPPATVPDEYYWALAEEGSNWNPFVGAYHNKGLYYSDGVSWTNMATPYQATQADVNAGIVTDQFVTPATLNGWGTSGPGGQTVVFGWKYSTNTATSDPGTGFFRGNNSVGSLVTQLYINDITTDIGLDISALFTKVKGQWLIHIQQTNDATKYIQFRTNVPYTDNTGWWTLPVTYIQSTGFPLTNLQKCTFVFVNQNDTPSSQGSTGIQTFASPGLSIASGTTINIGAVTGWIVDNETNPLNPIQTYVNYPGVSGLTVTTIGSGLISYILLSSSGVISFQNTLPTSAQRKSHIWLGKASHPNLTSLAFINNEPDFILSPHASYNDLFQVLGPYINDGVIASANGANLNINISAGNIHGNGINFVTDNTNPNEVNTGPFSPLSFIPRTQTGLGGGFITAVDPGNYDVAGVVTAIPGGVNVSTIRYIYAVPNVGFVIQYGQTAYSTLTEAIANVGRETQVIYSNLLGNAILIGVLVCKKSTTQLNNTADARFYQADKLGQIVGSTAGVATGTLQTAYNNSVDPEILTDSTRDGVTIRRGSAADTDNILVGQNGAGTTTWYVNGNGDTNYWKGVAGTPTRVGNTSFTITDTANANLYDLKYGRTTILKWTDTAVTKMAMIVNTVYAANAVTITIIGDTLAASATMSTMSYSHEKCKPVILAIAGTMATGTDLTGRYNVPCMMKIFGVDGYHTTAGTTNATTYDINLNGTTFMTTKLSIASGATSGLGFTADSGTVTGSPNAGAQSISVDCDSVSTTAPVDAYIELFMMPLNNQYL